MNNLIITGGGDNNVIVEASGCLSKCDKGPNVEISTKRGKVLLQEMTDAQTCAMQMGEVSSSTPSFPSVPKILLAACKVIQQSRQLSDSGQLKEEIQFLTSVIDKLEVSPAVPPSTAANADAHALRARARLELARNEKECEDGNEVPSSGDTIEAAIVDAQRVVKDLAAVATPASLTLAYRTWADAEFFLAEEKQHRQQEKEISNNGDFTRVVNVLKDFYRAQPKYRTKIQGEIQGLLLNM